ALQEARGVIERAMQNYRAHELMVDADALELVLPFGEELGLTGEEADLLFRSAMARGRRAPEWLSRAAPGAFKEIEDASRHETAEVRLSGIEGCLALRTPESLAILRRLSLWDPDLGVRKAASIALADRVESRAEDLLCDEGQSDRPGLVRRAVSLAIIRDYDKRMIRLQRLEMPVSLLVVLGLMWVRLRRGWPLILRQGSGGVFGGAASGIVGGLLLALGLSWAQNASAVDATKLVLVLVSLGTFLGTIGALGVSFGMVGASHVAYRHSRWWAVVGGAAGGAAVGGIFKLLGIDILRAVFGQDLDGIAGSFEGALLGGGVSLGAVAVGRLVDGVPPWKRVLAASLGAMCAGIALTVIGGNLFSGSLEIVARSFADSQIRLDPLAPLFGEGHFGKTTQVIFGAIEGLLFGGGLAAGMELLTRANGHSELAPSR
ncbi:MAG TPA: HEAT repeat domain-containing protein, partial [Blastocatellia bacterium]|nr:HEAT repeat domain-containing protein [Blastocatellia bacterium]